MLQTLTSTITATAMPPPPSSSPKQRRANPNPNSSSSICNHSPSATLDLLILILVLFSCAFLIASLLSHVVRSLQEVLPPLDGVSLIPYLIGLVFSIAVSLALLELSRSCRSRRCRNPNCKGLRKSAEFDVRLQTEEECVNAKKSGSGGSGDGVGGRDELGWKEIDALPWKGGHQGNNPDYECLRMELRRMAPLNGRAVLLFRACCGCPIAKLEGWGPRRGGSRSGSSGGGGGNGRRNRKGMANLALEGADHR